MPQLSNGYRRFIRRQVRLIKTIKAEEPYKRETTLTVILGLFCEAPDLLREYMHLAEEQISQRVHAFGSNLVGIMERNVLALGTLSVGSVAAFIGFHAIIVSYRGLAPLERIMAIGLLGCEAIFANNRIGYVYSYFRSTEFKSARNQFLARTSSASVACLVTVCDEPIAVIGETVASICAMRYENMRVYILDDSGKSENIDKITELARSLGVTVIRREGRRHYKAGNLNNALAQIDTDYIAVFDADQRPSVDFLRDIVPSLDEDPGLALVQTRQDYENSHSPIAHAAAIQSGLFYDHICEGKDAGGAMFCCGTNFVMRREALMDVGGFDTASITEDLATTMKLHANGWRTAYNDKLYATGLGPETLGEYFKQHSRWATGTFQVLKMAIRMFFTRRRALSAQQWFDYWLSFSYYLSGPANFYLLLLPSAYVLLGIGLIKAQGPIYLALFVVAFLSSWVFFSFTLIKRGYPARELIVVCARLETCKFAVYTEALVAAFLGRKRVFKVTEKGNRAQPSWFVFAVPLAVLGLNAIAVVVGLYRLGLYFDIYMAINTFWAGLNVWQLSAIIQYNSGSVMQNIQYLTPLRDESYAAAELGQDWAGR